MFSIRIAIARGNTPIKDYLTGVIDKARNDNVDIYAVFYDWGEIKIFGYEYSLSIIRTTYKGAEEFVVLPYSYDAKGGYKINSGAMMIIGCLMEHGLKATVFSERSRTPACKSFGEIWWSIGKREFSIDVEAGDEFCSLLWILFEAGVEAYAYCR